MNESITMKKALFTIRKLKQLLMEQNHDRFSPIAIVGMSCRFPQAQDKNDYWKMLIEGKNIISTLPEQRWALLQGSNEQGVKNSKHLYWGGFLENITAFDSYFFGITPREAQRMDPQQRQLLEVAYEAIEDAGITLDALSGSRTGVFTSLYASPFLYMQKADTEMDALYLPTGNAVSMAANRLSYLFDLKGPSIVLDTACSSSLVSLQLACLHLHTQLCDLALVGAANINLLPSMQVLLSQAKMLSPNGQCKTFDAAANGYVQGEGLGMIVLKPLAKALKDQDRIYAVIAGCAVNQDGKTNGLTAPNGAQQEEMLMSAYRMAQIPPQQVSYVECHGTGTVLGDPIEIQALGNIISQDRTNEKPCWIGSVKTNIGHLEPAAGIASVIKVALALQHKKIPPHLHFKTPNPLIDFDQYHFHVPQTLQEWTVTDSPRIAGISGFGFGGTNAHIVLRELTAEEEQQITLPQTEDITPQLFILSAKESNALTHLIQKWRIHLEQHPDLSLAQLCYNTQLRRSHYFYRLAIIVSSTNELKKLLAKLEEKPLSEWKNSGLILINSQKEKVNLPDCADPHPLLPLALAYVNRSSIHWKEQHTQSVYPHEDMPLYPWQHKNYWPDLSLSPTQMQEKEVNTYPFSYKKVSSPLPILQFNFKFSINVMPEIADTFNFLHVGYYLEMLKIAHSHSHEAGESFFQKDNFVIENWAFTAPIFVPPDAIIQVQLTLDKRDDLHYDFSFYSQTQEHAWTQHASGQLTQPRRSQNQIIKINDVKKRCDVHGDTASFCERVMAMGMPSGGSICWTKHYWTNEHEILCEFSEPPSAHQREKFKLNIHPGILDACVQSLFMLLPQPFLHPYVASKIGRFTHYGIKDHSWYLYAQMKNIALSGEQYLSDFFLLDSQGHTLFECRDLCMTQLNKDVQLGRVAKETPCSLNLSSLSFAEKRQKIIAYLTQQIAIIFSMPETDIPTQRSLSDMGLDSSMAMVLASTIESSLHMTYPMQSILKGPTIEEIADAVLTKNHAPSTYSNANKPGSSPSWIAYRKKQENAKFRLFCFPYGGGGASIYRDWQSHLAPFIEVCPIQLPGREYRMDEKPVSQVTVLIDELIEHLLPEFDLPFAFFGHSFGALIAFELARTLRERHLPQPCHLFASAFPDPRMPTKSLDHVIADLRAIKVDLFNLGDTSGISQLNDTTLEWIADIFIKNGLVEHGNEKLSKEIVKIFLPIFISDMTMVKNYSYYAASSLDLPISVFLGKRDSWVAYEDHLGWAAHTQKKFTLHEFDAGHLFIREEAFKKEVIQKIMEHISIGQ